MNIGNNWSKLPSPDMMKFLKLFVAQEGIRLKLII